MEYFGFHYSDFRIFFTAENFWREFKLVAALRLLRALRPLRSITFNDGLRMLITALLSAMPGTYVVKDSCRKKLPYAVHDSCMIFLFY